jgi:hypothetical protein
MEEMGIGEEAMADGHRAEPKPRRGLGLGFAAGGWVRHERGLGLAGWGYM